MKKLIKEEARFMMGVEPEIRIHPLNAAGEQDRAACAQIEDWLGDFLHRNKWGDKLIKGARDCFIGKRVALKLTGRRGERWAYGSGHRWSLSTTPIQRTWTN